MRTLAHDRFTRWQAMAINQLSVALALISSLSTAGLGACISLMQATTQHPGTSLKIALIFSAALFLVAIFLGVLSVITRALDFRLTARSARQKQTGKSEADFTIWLITSDQYGRLTWILFWLSLVAFMAAGSLLTFSVAASYACKAGLFN